MRSLTLAAEFECGILIHWTNCCRRGVDPLPFVVTMCHTEIAAHALEVSEVALQRDPTGAPGDTEPTYGPDPRAPEKSARPPAHVPRLTFHASGRRLAWKVRKVYACRHNS